MGTLHRVLTDMSELAEAEEKLILERLALGSNDPISESDLPLFDVPEQEIADVVSTIESLAKNRKKVERISFPEALIRELAKNKMNIYASYFTEIIPIVAWRFFGADIDSFLALMGLSKQDYDNCHESEIFKRLAMDGPSDEEIDEVIPSLFMVIEAMKNFFDYTDTELNNSLGFQFVAIFERNCLLSSHPNDDEWEEASSYCIKETGDLMEKINYKLTLYKIGRR